MSATAGVGSARQRVLWIVLAAIAALGVALLWTSSAQAADGTDRLAGDDRFETAIAISQHAFPEGADRLYIARAYGFADALAAGALDDGPILLVPSDASVPGAVLDEVERLDPDSVVALGGTGAVSDAVLDQTAGPRETDRLAGADRFETAAEIAAAAYPNGAEKVYLANAFSFPDALAAGSLSDGPILLVPGSGSAPSAVTGAINDMNPDEVVALGGSTVVGNDVLTSAAGGVSTSRLAGSDRYETSALIARAAFPDTAERVYLARADDFADALAAGALSDGPVVLVPSTGAIPQTVRDAVEAIQPMEIFALGGTVAVGDDVLDESAELRAEDVVFLEDREATDGGGRRWDEGSAQVDGLEYERSVWRIARGSPGFAEYDLARDYERFRATLGVRDDSTSDAEFRVIVSTDGNERFRDRVRLGETVDLDVDLTDALRLRIEVEGIDDTDRSDSVVFGNARILRDADRDVDLAPLVRATDRPERLWLDDDEAVQGGGRRWDEGSAQVDGLEYERSVWRIARGSPGFAEYDLARDYERFRATLGVRDDSTSDAEFRVIVSTDGNERFRDRVRLGETVDLDVDLTDALRLRIEVEGIDDTDRSDSVVFGNARILRDADHDFDLSDVVR
ncbi:hypothetical protein ER308_15440 [Egibacter rhizosphaerae]|uniref:Glycosyl hydrolase family 98 putative carbohydrate-binding module domain-containing protein n=1 Tax=Egibacter rhizosphaerae TaxID=1670831 RepID=A0A411YHT0_9ACTN|nr:cell wall-binding repeat-containing protein [Egibacter rhizosphaerae]QBI20824.1 hypothetical protein ER308_15440 [Egibacter rhizosphaerae]